MTTNMIRQIAERRAATWQAAKNLLDTVERSGRDLQGEDLAQWNNLNEELSQFDARLEELRSAEARNLAAENVTRQFRGQPPSDTVGGNDGELVRSFITGDRRSMNVDLKSVSTTVGHDGRRETRDLLVGGGSGPNTVPRSFRAQLVEHLVQMSGMRQTNATVLVTASGEDLQVPKTTALSTAALVDEADLITESDPTFAQSTLGSYKYAVMLQASRELVEDSGIDLVGYLARETGQALGVASGAHYVVGTGTDQPQGVTSAASVGKTGAAAVAGVFTADDLIDLFYSVIPPYRVNGFWLMNDATAAAVRKLKDPGGDHYLWEQSLAADTPNLLLGRPVVIDPNVPAIGATNRSVLFGDFSRYFIRDVSGIRFERSDDFAFDHDLVTWRAILRTDGDLVDATGAVKAFVGGAAA